MVVSYTNGLSESFKSVCGKMGIQVHLKGNNIIRSLLVALKDKDNIIQKCGVIYMYRCDRLQCYEEYTGESARTFEERLKEHLRAPFPSYEHANTIGHHTRVGNFSNVVRSLTTSQ